MHRRILLGDDLSVREEERVTDWSWISRDESHGRDIWLTLKTAEDEFRFLLDDITVRGLADTFTFLTGPAHQD